MHQAAQQLSALALRRRTIALLKSERNEGQQMAQDERQGDTFSRGKVSGVKLKGHIDQRICLVALPNWFSI